MRATDERGGLFTAEVLGVDGAGAGGKVEDRSVHAADDQRTVKRALGQEDETAFRQKKLFDPIQYSISPHRSLGY
jgi:hypothetical protein